MRVVQTETFLGQVHDGLEQFIRVQRGGGGGTHPSHRLKFGGARLQLLVQAQRFKMQAGLRRNGGGDIPRILRNIRQPRDSQLTDRLAPHNQGLFKVNGGSKRLIAQRGHFDRVVYEAGHGFPAPGEGLPVLAGQAPCGFFRLGAGARGVRQQADILHLLPHLFDDRADERLIRLHKRTLHKEPPNLLVEHLHYRYPDDRTIVANAIQAFRERLPAQTEVFLKWNESMAYVDYFSAFMAGFPFEDRMEEAESLLDSDPGAALHEARIAAALDPMSIDAARMVARLLQSSGLSPDDEKAAWERLLDLVPDDPEATEALAALESGS